MKRYPLLILLFLLITIPAANAKIVFGQFSPKANDVNVYYTTGDYASVTVSGNVYGENNVYPSIYFTLDSVEYYIDGNLVAKDTFGYSSFTFSFSRTLNIPPGLHFVKIRAVSPDAGEGVITFYADVQPSPGSQKSCTVYYQGVPITMTLEVPRDGSTIRLYPGQKMGLYGHINIGSDIRTSYVTVSASIDGSNTGSWRSPGPMGTNIRSAAFTISADTPSGIHKATVTMQSDWGSCSVTATFTVEKVSGQSYPMITSQNTVVGAPGVWCKQLAGNSYICDDKTGIIAYEISDDGKAVPISRNDPRIQNSPAVVTAVQYLPPVCEWFDTGSYCYNPCNYDGCVYKQVLSSDSQGRTEDVRIEIYPANPDPRFSNSQEAGYSTVLIPMNLKAWVLRSYFTPQVDVIRIINLDTGAVEAEIRGFSSGDRIPAVYFEKPGDGSVLSNPVQIVARAEDDVQVVKIEIYNGAQLLKSCTGSAQNLTCEISLNLPNGNYTLKAVAYDNANQKAEATVSFSVKGVDNPPTVTITSPQNGAVFTVPSDSASVTVSATASDDYGIAKIELYLDGSLIASCTSSSCSKTVSVSAGSHTVKAIAYDTANQKAEANVSFSVVVDSPPKVWFYYPGNDGYKIWTSGDSAQVTVDARASDDKGVVRMEVYIDGKLVNTCSYSTSCSGTATLAVGTHTAKAVAYDTINQQAEASVSFSIVKNNPPSFESTQPPGGTVEITGDSYTFTMSATVVDDTVITRIELRLDGNLIQTCTPNTQRATCSATVTVAPGQHHIHFTAYDDEPSRNTQMGYYIYVIKKVVCPQPVNGVIPRDVNGDGLLEDFNNDGMITQADVETFAFNLNSMAIQACWQLYDYDRNGVLNAMDILALAEMADMAPWVQITSPQDGAVLTSPVTIRAEAHDDRSLSRVEIYLDGNLVKTCTGSSTSLICEVTLSVSPGSHTAQAVAYDSIGQRSNDAYVGTRASFTVMVVDNPPTVTITSPQNGAVFTVPSDSASVTISATASDDKGVNRIELYLDGGYVTTCYSTSCSIQRTVGVGSHTVKAIAYDTANQKAEASVSFSVVKDTPPSVSITSPPNGATYWTTSGSYTVTISATASDDKGVSRIELYLDGSYVTTCYSTSCSAQRSVGTGSHTVKAVAYDTINQQAEASVSFTVARDNPPSVSITSPSSGATYRTTADSYTVTISATASDDRGVSRIELYLDGGYVTTCYSTSCSAQRTVGVGSHSVTAYAYDTAGQSASASISFTVVKNYPPSVWVTSPPNGATYVAYSDTYTVTVSASASDPDGIYVMGVAVDGQNVVACWSATTCSGSATVGIGSHTATGFALDNYYAPGFSSPNTFTVCRGVSTSDLQKAIQKWLNGQIDTSTLNIIINAWQYGTCIPDSLIWVISLLTPLFYKLQMMMAPLAAAINSILPTASATTVPVDTYDTTFYVAPSRSGYLVEVYYKEGGYLKRVEGRISSAIRLEQNQPRILPSSIILQISGSQVYEPVSLTLSNGASANIPVKMNACKYKTIVSLSGGAVQCCLLSNEPITLLRNQLQVSLTDLPGASGYTRGIYCLNYPCTSLSPFEAEQIVIPVSHPANPQHWTSITATIRAWGIQPPHYPITGRDNELYLFTPGSPVPLFQTALPVQARYGISYSYDSNPRWSDSPIIDWINDNLAVCRPDKFRIDGLVYSYPLTCDKGFLAAITNPVPNWPGATANKNVKIEYLTVEGNVFERENTKAEFTKSINVQRGYAFVEGSKFTLDFEVNTTSRITSAYMLKGGDRVEGQIVDPMKLVRFSWTGKSSDETWQVTVCNEQGKCDTSSVTILGSPPVGMNSPPCGGSTPVIGDLVVYISYPPNNAVIPPGTLRATAEAYANGARITEVYLVIATSGGETVCSATRYSPDSGNTYSITCNLNEGSYTFTAYAHDSLGRSKSDRVSFTVRSGASAPTPAPVPTPAPTPTPTPTPTPPACPDGKPSVSFIEPRNSEYQIKEGDTYLLPITVSYNDDKVITELVIYVDNEEIYKTNPNSASGSVSTTTELPQGTYTLKAVVKDSCDQAAETTMSVRITKVTPPGGALPLYWNSYVASIAGAGTVLAPATGANYDKGTLNYEKVESNLHYTGYLRKNTLTTSEQLIPEAKRMGSLDKDNNSVYLEWPCENVPGDVIWFIDSGLNYSFARGCCVYICPPDWQGALTRCDRSC
jgi:hypothetical protein